MDGAFSTYGGEERHIEVFDGKPEGKRLLGRPRRRLQNNIKIELQEDGWWAWTGSSWLRIETGGGHL
jgi:hypothetical protein